MIPPAGESPARDRHVGRAPPKACRVRIPCDPRWPGRTHGVTTVEAGSDHVEGRHDARPYLHLNHSERYPPHCSCLRWGQYVQAGQMVTNHLEVTARYGGADVALSGGSRVAGTILAPVRKVSLSGTSQVIGGVIAGLDVALSGGSTIRLVS